MEWWRKLKPIKELDNDGQSSRRVYARKLGGQWEYAIVTFDEDDDPRESIELLGGKVGEFTWE